MDSWSTSRVTSTLTLPTENHSNSLIVSDRSSPDLPCIWKNSRTPQTNEASDAAVPSR